jgi:hypothetical protein
VITSPFTSVEEVNVEEVAPPTFVPLSCHWYVGVAPPLVGVAVKVTGSPAQIVAPVEVILTEAATEAETVIVIVLDVTVAGEAQEAFDVMISVISSPSASVEEVNVEDVAPPAFVPFTCHWYVGVVPPFTGVPVNVTGSPAQIVEPVDVMLTEGTTTSVTVIVIPEDVAVNGEAHAALDVITTVTTSPLFKVVLVKVADVAPPTFVPLICH